MICSVAGDTAGMNASVAAACIAALRLSMSRCDQRVTGIFDRAGADETEQPVGAAAARAGAADAGLIGVELREIAPLLAAESPGAAPFRRLAPRVTQKPAMRS